jgi:hypothetical protein
MQLFRPPRHAYQGNMTRSMKNGVANVLTVPLHSATLLHCHAPAHQGRLLDILLKTIPQSTLSTLDRRRLWTQLWLIHDQSAHFRLPVHSGIGSTDNFGTIAWAVYGSRVCPFRAVCNRTCINTLNYHSY